MLYGYKRWLSSDICRAFVILTSLYSSMWTSGNLSLPSCIFPYGGCTFVHAAALGPVVE